ncbi:MAG: sarcosine oxidase subunit gamma [Amylibacter sp.]|nr:sarcosine oxidase subunit gamma [Amylibacter sp.]
MHNLKAITALGGLKLQTDTIAGLTISECPNWAIASVAARRGCEKTNVTAFKKALGLAFPKPMQSTGKAGITAFWTGPNQCFVEAPIDSDEALPNRLADALKKTASVTEQTDGWVRFDLLGTGCSDVFERLCILDTRTLKKGMVSRTSLEHSGCFILCRASDHFSVYGPRSTAASIHHALVTAAKSALG